MSFIYIFTNLNSVKTFSSVDAWVRTSTPKLLYSWVFSVKQPLGRCLRGRLLNYRNLRWCYRSRRVSFAAIACFTRVLRAVRTVIRVRLCYVRQVDLVCVCVGNSHVILEEFLLQRTALAGSR